MSARRSGPARLPMIPRDERTPEQSAVVHEIRSGPRGAFGGPFVPLLRTPILLGHLEKVGEDLRFGGSASRRLIEFVVLLTARRWNQEFEWGVHAPLALSVGLDVETIEAIARRERPPGMDQATEAVWTIFCELEETSQVSDGAFARAAAVLGEVALVELVVTMGYYTTLAMVMNLAATVPPDSDLAGLGLPGLTGD
jgi:4-carboxymuconolactone decarboxylase